MGTVTLASSTKWLRLNRLKLEFTPSDITLVTLLLLELIILRMSSLIFTKTCGLLPILSVDQTFYSLSNDFPTLGSDDKDYLIKPVTKGEVYRSLRSMPLGKSSGLDGFNVDFYIFFLLEYY